MTNFTYRQRHDVQLDEGTFIAELYASDDAETFARRLDSVSPEAFAECIAQIANAAAASLSDYEMEAAAFAYDVIAFAATRRYVFAELHPLLPECPADHRNQPGFLDALSQAVTVSHDARCVQHVCYADGDYTVNDWFDSSTVFSVANGRIC